MELNLWKFLLGECERVAGVGEEDIAAVLVGGHICVLTTLKVSKLLGIVALDPAGLVDRYGLPAALCAILVLETVLDNLKLERTHGTDNLAAVE